jgi:SAM-dependent methyltransferase
MRQLNDLWRLALDLVHDGDVVLDIGAGSGAFTSAALDRGAIVIAIDASKHRCETLGASHAQPRLRVLNNAVVSTVDNGLRFVDRSGVRRVVRTAADDGEVVDMTSVADLVAQFTPRLVRFRAVGHERALAPLALPAVLVASDALATNETTWPDHLAQTSAGVRFVGRTQPLIPSRHEGLFGTTVATHDFDRLTDDEALQWVIDESFVREPRRRVRLARLLEHIKLLPHGFTVVADRLALDPSDAVVDAMAWHNAGVTSLSGCEQNSRRLAAFESLVDHVSTARDGVERPAPLSLPR